MIENLTNLCTWLKYECQSIKLGLSKFLRRFLLKSSREICKYFKRPISTDQLEKDQLEIDQLETDQLETDQLETLLWVLCIFTHLSVFKWHWVDLLAHYTITMITVVHPKNSTGITSVWLLNKW